MSFLLRMYPAYQTAKCVVNPETEAAVNQHWLTFWMTTFFIDQLPLPSLISYPAVALLCLPESTTFVRNNVITRTLGMVSTYGPQATAKVYEFVGKYIYLPSEDELTHSRTWWQFWKPHAHTE
jgi:hypothetical protein